MVTVVMSGTGGSGNDSGVGSSGSSMVAGSGVGGSGGRQGYQW